MDCHSLRTHRRLVVLVVAGRLGLAGAVHHLLRRLRLPAHSRDAAAEYGVAVRDGVGAESRLRAGATETDDFSLEHMRDRRPNHALQRTRPSRSRSSPRCSWAGSLSLGSLGRLRAVKFQVEFLYAIESESYVFARRMEQGDFSLSASSRLGGAAIVPSVSQPRKIRPDGTPDLDVFAFVLTDRQDAQRFHVGQIVELHHDNAA